MCGSQRGGREGGREGRREERLASGAAESASVWCERQERQRDERKTGDGNEE